MTTDTKDDGGPAFPQYLLEWLGQEEFSQYGECYGKDLDTLIEAGVAQVHDDTSLQSGFIAQGRGPMYRAVSLTDAGRAMLAERNKP